MRKRQNSVAVRHVIDIAMTVLLLCLMAYQVTGEQAHEWLGMAMTALVVVHQILNRKWYGVLFKGKYRAFRVLQTVITLLLLLSFALTAFCGMSMSSYAVPFLYGMAEVSFVRRMHLSLSHWAFVLMGLHLGIHIPVLAAGWKLSEKKQKRLAAVFCCAAIIGLVLFLRSGMADYLFFRVAFAFLDYEKPAAAVLLENLLMLLFWAFTGERLARLAGKKRDRDSIR